MPYIYREESFEATAYSSKYGAASTPPISQGQKFVI